MGAIRTISSTICASFCKSYLLPGCFNLEHFTKNRGNKQQLGFVSLECFFCNQQDKGDSLEALSGYNDYELVRRIKDGEIDAFSEIVHRYQRPLQKLATSYVKDSLLAEDILQESFLKAFEKIDSFQFRSAFKSWLYRIVINTAKNSLRSKKQMVNIDDIPIPVDSECEKSVIDKQLLQQAKTIIENLPDKQKSAVNKRVFEDKSFKEVAAEMDCPYDTAKANYRHGLVKLKQTMVLTW